MFHKRPKTSQKFSNGDPQLQENVPSVPFCVSLTGFVTGSATFRSRFALWIPSSIAARLARYHLHPSPTSRSTS